MRGTRGGGGCAEGGGARSTRAVARATRVRAPRPPAAAACCCCCCCARTTARTRTTRGGGGGTCRPRPRRRRRRGRHAEGLFETLDETHARVRTPKTRTATHIEAARAEPKGTESQSHRRTRLLLERHHAQDAVFLHAPRLLARSLFSKITYAMPRARARGGPSGGPRRKAATSRRPPRTVLVVVSRAHRDAVLVARSPARSAPTPPDTPVGAQPTDAEHAFNMTPPPHTHTHAARRGGGAPARRETHPGARHAPQTRHAREARAWLASPARAQRIVCARV